jgi:hypothetical protein
MSYIDRPRHRTLFVPFNGKIADITHADTNKHTLDLAAALGETRKIISIFFKGNRIAGTGYFNTFPNEGVTELVWATGGAGCIAYILKDNTQEMQYVLTVANDDWDIYCYGYVVDGEQ